MAAGGALAGAQGLERKAAGPGTGEYEWQGFRKDLPSEFNPPRGYVATANHNITAGRTPRR